MNRGRHASREADLKRRFPHQVRVAVPPTGLGSVLTDLHAWCNETHGLGGWAHFALSQRAPAPKDWSIFAFATPEDAEAFRLQWGYEITIEDG